jgi:putative hemolysin
VLVTLVISYFSLVFSELAPKRLALQRPGGHLDGLRADARPHRHALAAGDLAAVQEHRRRRPLLGGDPRSQRESITEEELRDMVAATSR